MSNQSKIKDTAFRAVAADGSENAASFAGLAAFVKRCTPLRLTVIRIYPRSRTRRSFALEGTLTLPRWFARERPDLA